MDKIELAQSKEKSQLAHLIITVCYIFMVLTLVFMFNKYLLMSLALPLRMILMIVSNWLLLIGPAILMFINRENLSDIGFKKENILTQIAVGVILAFIFSLILTIVPIMFGFKDMVSSIRYTQVWQFLYHFIYVTFGVALAEEFVFRGYIFNKLLCIKNSKWFAIIISSVLFGFFHIFQGNIIQIFMTTFLGIIFCLLKEKIKNCTLLSLIVLHGLYDGMIVLWASIL
ncbi:MAG TPA: type II CAAX endopeptidase family protein [Defluviitaleaceae bacterium]|nr:type II CAAX endopeptidase family protein [Defluviitaleaceae bacterium]